MSDFEFSIKGLSDCNLNASSDKEYIEFGIQYINKRIDDEANYVWQLQDGQIAIDETTKGKLVAARATLLFFEAVLKKLQANSIGKEAVCKYYSQALESNQVKILAASNAEFLLKSYFIFRMDA